MADENLASAAVATIALRIPALDGFMLGAIHCSATSLASPETVVLFSCGGGIPAARYSRFAQYLAANGFPALVFDYRGIASSRTSELRGFKAVAEDWSELDCGGAIAHLRNQYPKAEIVGISHSIGALLIGGAPNVDIVSRFVFICPHTGYYADYMPMYRLPMALMWHGVMPVLTRILGYFPARSFRLGEDIPAGLAMQWAARRSPEFRPKATDPDGNRANAMIARYPSVHGRALAIGFTDDAFSTPAGTKRLLETFPAVQATSILIAPDHAGMASIGHFGFFRRSAEAHLWPFVVNFLRRGECEFCPAAAAPRK